VLLLQFLVCQVLPLGYWSIARSYAFLASASGFPAERTRTKDVEYSK